MKFELTEDEAGIIHTALVQYQDNMSATAESKATVVTLLKKFKVGDPIAAFKKAPHSEQEGRSASD